MIDVDLYCSIGCSLVMKKVFGQTVRDLKREVNKKVLKVPGIEQKEIQLEKHPKGNAHTQSMCPNSYPSKKEMGLRRKQAKHDSRSMNDSDILQWNVAISKHMRSGECNSALKVFNSMHRRSSVSYNAMISGYIMNDKFGLAKEMFDEMPERDLFSWNVMLSGYVRNRNLTAARELFEKMPGKDVVSWNTMLSGYAQNGFVDEARCLFDKMPTMNAISWNGLLSAYVQNGRLDDARKLFESKMDWHTVSWNCLIGGFVKRKRLVDARNLFDRMPAKDKVSWNTIITGYAQNGEVEEAQRLFDQSPSKDVFTWTSMVSGYVQNGLLNEARTIFDRMPVKNPISWNAMIAGYVQTKQMDLAGELFEAMESKNVSSWNTMITGYAQGGDITRARELFNEMPEHDSISWSAMIAGYVQNGFSEDALHLFVEMERTGERLNRSSITCALTACSDIAALELGKEVHGRLVKAGYHMGYYVGNSLLAMYCKCGSIDEARDAFHEIAERDVVSWNTMIHGYARHGFGKEALSLFESMKTEDIRPDEVTMVGVLSACGHAGLVDKGTECFDSMTQEYGITPNPVHYTCMVDLLGRAGRLKEAQELIKTMPFKADAAAWGALLGASRVHGNIKLGESVADTVFSMEPHNSGMYILLSNLYAALGRWPEVDRMRQKMRSEGVKKVPGYSWLEVQNKIHTFRVGDTSHPDKDMIYEFLGEMVQKMKQEGYISLTKLVLHDVEEEEKEHMLKYHSEKLAVAYGILSIPAGRPVRVMKNLREGQLVDVDEGSRAYRSATTPQIGGRNKVVSFSIRSGAMSESSGFDSPRLVTKKLFAKLQREGDGAAVRRSIGRSELRSLDPFLLLDVFSVSAPGGFPDHPLIHIEVLRLLHTCSRDHSPIKILLAIEALFMLGMFKIEPGYQELLSQDIKRAEKDGVQVRIIAGESMGIESPVYTRTPTMYLDFTMQPRSQMHQPILESWNAFVYIIEGEGVFGIPNSSPVAAHHTLVLGPGEGMSAWNKSSSKPLRFVLIAGQPLNQPVVQHGPFVMNTESEIHQAIEGLPPLQNGFEMAESYSQCGGSATSSAKARGAPGGVEARVNAAICWRRKVWRVPSWGLRRLQVQLRHGCEGRSANNQEVFAADRDSRKTHFPPGTFTRFSLFVSLAARSRFTFLARSNPSPSTLPPPSDLRLTPNSRTRSSGISGQIGCSLVMKKVFGQTVRDLKREVNKKVLKVPGIEQKVLDATSNEPWGPHGSLLADIAQATKNYHEYQMIMAVLWKRINDTGKNWRHVYKGLTVLEYLVAHGSERVIDDIKEHGYQISTLSDFQYIDSSGRDQGSNVRKKSQTLVVLVNDKERIIEVRQKAAANRTKFRSPSAGGMHRPGSSGGEYGDRYDDDRYEGRYGSRDEDRNGYGRERDNDRSGKYGDSYNRDGARDDEQYGRDGYRDDEYRGRSRSNDGYGSRGRSSDRERDRGYDDDGQFSSRGSDARADDQSEDGRGLQRKYSEQNIGAPPSYEQAVNDAHSPVHSEKRNGESSAPSGPATSSPLAPQSSSPPAPQASQSSNNNVIQESTVFSSSLSPANQEVVVDEFDPRGSFAAFPTASAVPTVSAASATASNAEMDLLGSLSESFGPSAIVPVSSPLTASEVDIQPSFSGPSFASSTQPPSAFSNQEFEDPFGDTPFKAAPSTESIPTLQETEVSDVLFQNSANQYPELQHASVPNREMEKSLTFDDPASSFTCSAPNFHSTSTNSQFLPEGLSSSNQEIDILADILPLSGPSGAAHETGFPSQTSSPSGHFYGNFNSQPGPTFPGTPPTLQFSGGNYMPQGGFTGPTHPNMDMRNLAGPATQFGNGNLLPQSGYGAHQIPQQIAMPSGQLNNGNMFPYQSASSSMFPQVPSVAQAPTGPNAPHHSVVLGGFLAQGDSTPVAPQSSQILGSQPSLSSTTGALVPVVRPSNDKFETKSTVWADTLNRGLVNLNISGPKTNPLSDIGIDFDAINRKEKRMEKPSTTTVASTVTMGKAMGSGSGMGRAGATAMRPAPNPMMGMGMSMAGGPGSGIGMGMGGGPGSAIGMGLRGAPGSGMGMGGAPGPGMGGVPGLGMGMGGVPGLGMGMGGAPGPGMGMGMGGVPGLGMGMGGAPGSGLGYGGGMATTMGMGGGMGMGQGAGMQPPHGYNNMMGGAGGYPQQPYSGGFQ
ncbi:Pentatricopeptide repeat-containing protein At4g02750 [Linum grandiflorum]